ncbi:MAG: hypothetical protein ACJAXC_003816, partial [Sulfitobacter sp.]
MAGLMRQKNLLRGLFGHRSGRATEDSLHHSRMS